MKKALFLLVVVYIIPMFCTLSVAQEKESSKLVTADSRLVDAMGESFVERIEKENQNMVIYNNFFLDNSYYISELPDGKSDFLNSLKTLPISPETDQKEINVLKYELNLNFDKETYFRMENSNKVMIFYSNEDLIRKYNEHRRVLGLITETTIK